MMYQRKRPLVGSLFRVIVHSPPMAFLAMNVVTSLFDSNRHKMKNQMAKCDANDYKL